MPRPAPLLILMLSLWVAGAIAQEKQAAPATPATTQSATTQQATTMPTTRSAATRRVHVWVTGRVQGVGFRAFVQSAAQKLDVTGFVRNLDDGRVEAVAEGTAHHIDELLAKIKKGPQGSRVDAAEVKEEKPQQTFRGFRIEE